MARSTVSQKPCATREVSLHRAIFKDKVFAFVDAAVQVHPHSVLDVFMWRAALLEKADLHYKKRKRALRAGGRVGLAPQELLCVAPQNLIVLYFLKYDFMSKPRARPTRAKGLVAASAP